MASKALPTNEHNIERAVRVLLGIGLLSLVFVGPKTLWGLIGIIPLATGLIGSCPLYTVLGISTCPMKKSFAENYSGKDSSSKDYKRGATTATSDWSEITVRG